MKKIEKGSIKYLIIFTTLVIIFGIILYPLFDLILCKFITNSEFTYSIKDHIVEPIIMGTIMGVLLWLLDRPKNK